MKQSYIEEAREVNRSKKQQVKEEEEKVIRKNRMSHEQKLRSIKGNYLNRVEDEKITMHKRESDIARMEKIEAELLDRLKNSQKVEQDAFASLEQAIKSATGAYEERKKKGGTIRKPGKRNSTTASQSSSNLKSTT